MAKLGRVHRVFSSRRRHTRCCSDWSSDVCSSDLQPKEVSCRVALLKLHRRGLLRLPEIDQRSIPRPQRVLTEPARLEPASVESSLEALQPVSLLRIDSADSPHSRIWNELMNQEHYLGAGP